MRSRLFPFYDSRLRSCELERGGGSNLHTTLDNKNVFALPSG